MTTLQLSKVVDAVGLGTEVATLASSHRFSGSGPFKQRPVIRGLAALEN